MTKTTNESSWLSVAELGELDPVIRFNLDLHMLQLKKLHDAEVQQLHNECASLNEALNKSKFRYEASAKAFDFMASELRIARRENEELRAAIDRMAQEIEALKDGRE